jgi:5-methylcytosine-specific restriction protein B
MPDLSFLSDRSRTLTERAKFAVNAYLEVALEQGLLEAPDAEDIERQRQNFIELFGPEELEKLSEDELLVQLPYNLANDRSMDYWLEFGNDDKFGNRTFGSIMGGAASKFGTWQERDRGAWRAKAIGSNQMRDITEEQAKEILATRRDEMIASVEVIDDFAQRFGPARNIDPVAFQEAIEKAAPTWNGHAWLHKYLHVMRPGYVTWSATIPWSVAELHWFGIQAAREALYACDVQICALWSDMPALEHLPVEVRYRMARGLLPRQHWCYQVASDDEIAVMVRDDCFAMGPPEVLDLSEVIKLEKKAEIQDAMAVAFEDAGLSVDSDAGKDLIEFAYRLQEGTLVALIDEKDEAVAIGEISGAYTFDSKAQSPHQVPVKWTMIDPFEAKLKAKASAGRLRRLKGRDAVVGRIEASLLIHGVAPWPEYDRIITRDAPLPPELPREIEEEPVRELAPLVGMQKRLSGMLDRKKQIILYGPPGTGKTHHAERLALELVARQNFHRTSNLLSRKQRARIFGEDGSPPYIEACTFHPMYSYEDFIEGYRPDGAGFSLRDGIFKRLSKVASAQPEKRFVLIIDEINRGNIPRIFGELITLIESTRRGKVAVTLPLSGERFMVPENLSIIGTMNTADRSILLLDAALRRRFAFEEMMPDPALLAGVDFDGASLATWLAALNRRILEQLGKDGRNLQIGHAYLMHAGVPITTPSRFAEVFRDDIWPLLQEYCYGDDRKLAAILSSDRGGVYDPKRSGLRSELFDPSRRDDLLASLFNIVSAEDRRFEVIEEEQADD